MKRTLVIHITFKGHAPSKPNDDGLAVGWSNPQLSPNGRRVARDLAQAFKQTPFDAIYSSDLKRAQQTARKIAGKRGIPVFSDARLRECDYGDFALRPKRVVDAERIRRVHEPFPNGESYEQVATRYRALFRDLLKRYAGRDVSLLIIGHRATKYMLAHACNGLSVEEAVRNHQPNRTAQTFVLSSVPND